MGTKFRVPNNTLSISILHAILTVLKAELVTGPDLKIKWPHSVEGQNAAMAPFLLKHGLPSVIRAIDGSFLLMRKPSVNQTGQDTDSYLGIKGK